jgi:hypothetical protein
VQFWFIARVSTPEENSTVSRVAAFSFWRQIIATLDLNGEPTGTLDNAETPCVGKIKNANNLNACRIPARSNLHAGSA